MINYTEQLMYGLMPVQRDDPQAGQSAYYYFDPRYGDDDARHIIDVPDGTSPNPNAGAIQQYLYENDEYRYKNLYGDTPPPTQTAVNDYTVNTENLMGKPSSYFQDNNSVDWSGNTAGIGVNPSYDTTTVLQNQTPTPWNGNYIPPNAYNSQPFSYQDMVPNAGRQIERRNLENELLMNGMDVLYGANRTLNGMSFGGLDWLGNKLGFDAQMNNYLQIKDPQSQNLAQAVGQLAELGGGALVGSALAKAGYNQANMAYNGYKIGKKYDQLVENPFQGSGSDVITRMKNHNGEPVVLQRGEAIPGKNGNVVVYGKDLKRATGTERNQGLNKGIYKHEVSCTDAQRIPRIIQQKPAETNNYGQNVYLARSKNGTFRVVTSPKSDYNIISSMYYPTIDIP